MKNILVTFWGIILISCNNQQVNNHVNNNTIAQSKDTITKGTAAKDTSLEKVLKFFNNPFRDINNFDVKFGDRFIDSLHSLYSNKRQIKGTLIKDICIGDNCESYKTIINKQEHTILYIFKGDGGEYGFSNDQFYLNKDTLTYARNYNVNIETWPTDTSNTVWKIEETVYNFQSDKPYKRTRTAYTRDVEKFDFTLANATPAFDNTINLEKALEEKLTQLNKLLEMKDSEYRE